MDEQSTGQVSVGYMELSEEEFVRILQSDQAILGRLVSGDRLRVSTPLRYPGRRGAIVLRLDPGEKREDGSTAVRISDGGLLLKSLEEQGMDLTIDMIISKTVFHAVKQHEGAGISAGETYLDSSTAALAADLWRYLQMVVEIVGLRHSKYKDALVQLSRGQDAPDLLRWEPR